MPLDDVWLSVISLEEAAWPCADGVSIVLMVTRVLVDTVVSCEVLDAADGVEDFVKAELLESYVFCSCAGTFGEGTNKKTITTTPITTMPPKLENSKIFSFLSNFIIPIPLFLP